MNCEPEERCERKPCGVINSEAIAGVDVPSELAARLLNEVLQEPLPDIG